MYEISIVHFAGKEVFSHMTFSSNCLANTSRKLGTYLLRERPVDFQGGAWYFLEINISALIFAQKNISAQS